MDSPLALSWEQQIDLLKERGLIVEEHDVVKIQNISYYRLKEFAQPFAKDVDGCIKYENITFHEVLGRYYQDKNLRIFLFCSNWLIIWSNKSPIPIPCEPETGIGSPTPNA